MMLSLLSDISFADVYLSANIVDGHTALAIVNIVYEIHDPIVSFLCEKG